VDLVTVCWQLRRSTAQRMNEARWELRMPKQQIADEAITEYLDRRMGGGSCTPKTSG
jgi:hypothetical protein